MGGSGDRWQLGAESPRRPRETTLESLAVLFPSGPISARPPVGSCHEEALAEPSRGHQGAWFSHWELQSRRPLSRPPMLLIPSHGLPVLSPLEAGIYYGDNRFDTVSESGTAYAESLAQSPAPAHLSLRW